jgi:hypothetical protein
LCSYEKVHISELFDVHVGPQVTDNISIFHIVVAFLGHFHVGLFRLSGGNTFDLGLFELPGPVQIDGDSVSPGYGRTSITRR